MPSTTDKQMRFFGVVRAIQKGEFEGTPSAAAKKAARTMSPEDVREFASSTKGSPSFNAQEMAQGYRRIP